MFACGLIYEVARCWVRGVTLAATEGRYAALIADALGTALILALLRYCPAPKVPVDGRRH